MNCRVRCLYRVRIYRCLAEECLRSNDLKLYEQAKAIGADWQKLATTLGISYGVVRIIEADVQTTVERAYKMLRDWYRDQGSQAELVDVSLKIEAIQREKKELAKKSRNAS